MQFLVIQALPSSGFVFYKLFKARRSRRFYIPSISNWHGLLMKRASFKCSASSHLFKGLYISRVFIGHCGHVWSQAKRYRHEPSSDYPASSKIHNTGIPWNCHKDCELLSAFIACAWGWGNFLYFVKAAVDKVYHRPKVPIVCMLVTNFTSPKQNISQASRVVRKLTYWVTKRRFSYAHVTHREQKISTE